MNNILGGVERKGINCIVINGSVHRESLTHRIWEDKEKPLHTFRLSPFFVITYQ